MYLIIKTIIFYRSIQKQKYVGFLFNVTFLIRLIFHDFSVQNPSFDPINEIYGTIKRPLLSFRDVSAKYKNAKSMAELNIYF